jgi:transcriptional regulator with XRE-family HTH domain
MTPIMAPPPAPTLQQIARAQIKHWIDTTGTTQSAICKAIDRNQPWLSRYLSGDIDADIDTLAKIAKVFDHTLFALLSLPADPEEAHITRLYRGLRPEGRRAALAVLQEMGRPRGHTRSRK